MSALDEWVNPRYLDPEAVEDIRQAVLAKPHVRYAVLDGFFNEGPLERLIAAHAALQFDEAADRIRGGVKLPYDAAVKFADRQSVGEDLFYDPEWQEYCAHLVSVTLPEPSKTEIKLRWHRPDADGFWIHTDGRIRQMVAICYFNKGWTAADGGLLQLWLGDGALSSGPVRVINNPTGRMDFLNENKRIRSSSPGGGVIGGPSPSDFLLLDQVVPCYNRLFLCNFQSSPAYHSITPSNGKARTGFVQWMGVNNE